MWMMSCLGRELGNSFSFITCVICLSPNELLKGIKHKWREQFTLYITSISRGTNSLSLYHSALLVRNNAVEGFIRLKGEIVIAPFIRETDKVILPIVFYYVFPSSLFVLLHTVTVVSEEE